MRGAGRLAPRAGKTRGVIRFLLPGAWRLARGAYWRTR